MFDQAFINGILMGGVFALNALSFSLIFGVMDVINVIHGSFILIGAYITYWLWIIFNIDPLVCIPITFVMLFAVGYFIQSLIINRIIDKPAILTFLLTFGLNMVLSNLMIYYWASDIRTISISYTYSSFSLGNVLIPFTKIIAFIFAIIMFVAFHIFLICTQVGRKIRASAQDKMAAQLMGINVSRIYSLVYALGTGFDGIAGTLIAITTPFSCIDVGYYILTAFFVVVLGGAGSLLGALTGGIMLGLIQSFTGTFLGIRFMNLVMFLFLVIILIIKPEGLFGK